jgi:hypothetical protein
VSASTRLTSRNCSAQQLHRATPFGALTVIWAKDVADGRVQGFVIANGLPGFSTTKLEITWFDWSAVDLELCSSRKIFIALRRRHPVFRRRRYSTGKSAADLRWFTPAGTEMTTDNWSDPMARSVALFIDGATDPDVGADGTPMTDDDFLMLVNSRWEPLTFTLPAGLSVRCWDIVCDRFGPSRTGTAGRELTVEPPGETPIRGLLSQRARHSWPNSLGLTSFGGHRVRRLLPSE